MRFLEYPGALLAAKIPVALAIAELEYHDGLIRRHVPAADGVLLDHAGGFVGPAFILSSRMR